MLDILNSVIITITSVITFLVHQIETLLSFLLHIPQYIVFVTTTVGFLPSLILPFAVASITIWVCLFLLGR